MIFGGNVSFEILEVVTSDGFQMFNYFFTIVTIFGLLSFGLGLLIRVITRS